MFSLKPQKEVYFFLGHPVPGSGMNHQPGIDIDMNYQSGISIGRVVLVEH